MHPTGSFFKESTRLFWTISCRCRIEWSFTILATNEVMTFDRCSHDDRFLKDTESSSESSVDKWCEGVRIPSSLQHTKQTKIQHWIVKMRRKVIAGCFRKRDLYPVQWAVDYTGKYDKEEAQRSPRKNGELTVCNVPHFHSWEIAFLYNTSSFWSVSLLLRIRRHARRMSSTYTGYIWELAWWIIAITASHRIALLHCSKVTRFTMLLTNVSRWRPM